MYRIRALRDIPRWGGKAGDLGGYVESEENLDQHGLCWVRDDALVWGNARVQQEKDLLVMGLERAYTTFYRTNTGISVFCDDFSGTLEEFRERETHDDTNFREYKLLCQLAEMHILGQK